MQKVLNLLKIQIEESISWPHEKTFVSKSTFNLLLTQDFLLARVSWDSSNGDLSKFYFHVDSAMITFQHHKETYLRK